MTKDGWWSVSFEVALGGIPASIEDLSEENRQHIKEMVAAGYEAGEISEECEDADDNCENGTYNCDSCRRNGDCLDQGMDGRPSFLEEELEE